MENRIKKKIKHHLIVNGSIRAGYQFFLTISGVALIFLDVKVWDTDWIMYFGLVLAGIGGLSARAETLKIKPFEESPYPPGWLDRKNEEDSSSNN